MTRLTVVGSEKPDGAAERLAARLAAEEDRGLLRFLTCGSVDDGKSTLIGRLLYDSAQVYEDQLKGAQRGDKRAGGEIDLALLVDGLAAEREQGITIDVAYRYFQTPRRKFIVADTPGHVQYTRNMATGASNCDFAILLVDARNGVLNQTRRHACIVSLLGIRKIAVAVNKMDLIDYEEAKFEAIAEDFRAFAAPLGFEQISFIPVSALKGENVFKPSTHMHWYHGPTLIGHLETVKIGAPAKPADGCEPFRMPVQWVNRPHLDFRGYSGTIASGSVKAGDEVVIQPSGTRVHLARIVTADGDLPSASAGDAVTLVFAEEIDVSRGDVVAKPDNAPSIADQIAAKLIWFEDEPMLPGRSYAIKCGCQTTTATISSLKYKLNVDNLDHVAAKTLELNEVGMCNISTGRPLVFDPYAAVRDTGSFLLIDRLNNATVAAGMIEFGLRRATNLQWQELSVDKVARASLKGQKPCVLWFTGLSGSGKSTIANLVEKRLHAMGRHTYVLDGDNVRHGLNKDLGFADVDRVENIRRVAETAKLFVDAGLIVMVSFISPFRSERRMARDLLGDGEFLEVFVDTPLEVCEQRDPKGLYKKARAGLIRNFTGIDSHYELPENADVALQTAQSSPELLAEQLLTELRRRAII